MARDRPGARGSLRADEGESQRLHPVEHRPVARRPVRAAALAVAVEDVEVTGGQDPVAGRAADEGGEVGDDPVGRCVRGDPRPAGHLVRPPPGRVHRDDQEGIDAGSRDARGGERAGVADGQPSSGRIERPRLDPLHADPLGELRDRRPPASRGALVWLRPGRRVQLDAPCDLPRWLARLLEQRDIEIHLAEDAPRLLSACDVPREDLHGRQADAPFMRPVSRTAVPGRTAAISMPCAPAVP